MAKGVSKELAKRATSYLVALAFAVTYLTATLADATPLDALLRGCIAAIATLVVGQLLCQTVVGVLLDSLARERAQRQADQAKEDKR